MAISTLPTSKEIKNPLLQVLSDGVKCYPLFGPQFGKVKTSIVAQIPVCVKYPNAECGR